jgi:lysozyme
MKPIYWIIFLFIIILSSVGYLFLKENSPLFLREPPLSHSEYIFGLDVSHYQGRINWKRVSNSKHPIKFVFIRSTMGINGKDKQFLHNWRKAKDFGYIRGAYHYYRPNENPESQFLNYKKTALFQKKNSLSLVIITTINILFYF